MLNRDLQAPNDMLVRRVLGQGAESARASRLDEILTNHTNDALIFDVLPPLTYEGIEACRASWGDWQPQTQGDARFDLEDLSIAAEERVALAHGLIHCGGTRSNGNPLDDFVRAAFMPSNRGRSMEDRSPPHFKTVSDTCQEMIRSKRKVRLTPPPASGPAGQGLPSPAHLLDFARRLSAGAASWT